MKRKEDLFELIEAMSRTEKRYFTLNAPKSGRKANRYLELFQLINAMESYDEEALRARFSDSLPFDKAYLYDAILRAMREYHSARSRAARCKENLFDARYLFERGLYEQCSERLDEARRLALELGDQLTLLELNREFRRLALALKREGFEGDLRRYTQEKDDTLRHAQAEFLYLDLYEALLVEVQRRFQWRDPEERLAFERAHALEALSEESIPQSPLAQLRYYQCKALHCQLLGDQDKVREYFTAVVNWWDAHPKYKEEEFYRYVIDVSNLFQLHAYSAKNLANLLPTYVKKLEREKPASRNAERILFQKISHYRLVYYINMGLTENINRLVKEIEEGLEKFSVPAGSRSALIFNMAVLLFMRGYFADCMQWCGRLIGDRKSKYRQDIKTATYLLYLLSAYEIDDERLLEGAFRSTYRFFLKTRATSEGGFEAQALDFARNLIHAPLDARRGILRNFATYLQEVGSDSSRRISQGMDELLLYWVNSKLEGKTIPELIQAKSDG